MSDLDLFPIEQDIKVSENSDTWPETITAVISRKYPELTKYIDKTVVQQLKKIEGYAIGYVSLGESNIRIPFIIENFVLLPLDVCIIDGRYRYLDRDAAKRAIASSWPFGKSIRFDHSPSMVKLSAVSLSNLTEKEIEEDKNLLKYANQLCESYPNVINDINIHLHQMESFKDLGKVNIGQEKIAHIEIDQYKTGITMRHFGIDDEQFTIKTASERFGNETINELMKLGIIRVPMSNIEVHTTELPTEIWNSHKNKDTRYPRTLNLSDGFGGFLRGNLYEIFDIQDPTRKRGMVFLSTRSKYPYYDILAPYNQDHKLYNTPEVGILDDIVDDLERPKTDIESGMAMGILMNGNIYGPFDVRSESHIGNERIFLVMDGYDANMYRLHMTNKVKTIIVDGHDIFVPDLSAKLIYLGRPVSKKEIEKTAAIVVTLTVSADKQHFNLIDNGVTGLPASNLQNLGKTKMITALMHAGLTEEESNAAINSALTKGTYQFHATPTATQPQAAVQSEVKHDIPKMTKTASIIKNIIDKYDLVKTAADFGSVENVDTVLGLRMITPDSVKRYKLLLPRISETIDGLCKLLLARRIGGSIVPIDANKLKTCIAGLSEIQGQLAGV